MKNIYKISKHTKRIFSIFMIFFQLRVTGIVSNTLNKNAVNDYHEIVTSFSEFLRSEGIDDVQSIYEYYNYAMWNGYFSKDHTLKYSDYRDIYFDNAGMGIMSGSGVCLNYADMLSLIFKEMGFNSNITMCYVNPNKISAEKIRTDKNIERKVDERGSWLFDNFILHNLARFSGNHAITCVEVDGELYFFDPTNFIYLNKTGINDVSIINGEGKFDLRYFTSLLFDNVNVYKLITSKNDNHYNNTVLEKQKLNINIEDLEKFYNSQKANIENVANNNEKTNCIVLLMICSTIASLIILVLKIRLKSIVDKLEKKDIECLIPKLKEYFSEKNIKTELEILKNYEIIENEFGIKDNLFKDIFNKTLFAIETLTQNRNFHHLMLNICLNYMEFSANLVHAYKYNKISKKDTVLIEYRDEFKNSYLYDYETEELLYTNELGELCSLDGKYKYRLESKDNKVDYDYHDKETIQNKMDSENALLTKEDIKTLKKNKTLRY